MGIDVGIKEDYAAVVEDRRVVYVGKFKDFDNLNKIKAAGIDAPLSFPKKGFRQCERLLLKMGIRLFPPNASFFKKIGIKGIKTANKLKSIGIEVFEVYPYASRVFLNIAPKAKKTLKNGREEILRNLSSFLEIKEINNHNEIDAIIAALTVKLYYDGKGILIKGTDGQILIPKPVNKDLQISLNML